MYHLNFTPLLVNTNNGVNHEPFGQNQVPVGTCHVLHVHYQVPCVQASGIARTVSFTPWTSSGTICTASCTLRMVFCTACTLIMYAVGGVM
jgi:hypothetical protein